MIYRENGQFKTTYKADQQIFPILQDRIGIIALVAFAFIGIPLMADEYLFKAIFIPFLILSLAALGVNLLVGYCGQITLGAGAFMAVGAYAAYNFVVRVDGIPLIAALLLYRLFYFLLPFVLALALVAIREISAGHGVMEAVKSAAGAVKHGEELKK